MKTDIYTPNQVSSFMDSEISEKNSKLCDNGDRFTIMIHQTNQPDTLKFRDNEPPGCGKGVRVFFAPFLYNSLLAKWFDNQEHRQCGELMAKGSSALAMKLQQAATWWAGGII